MWAHHGCRFMTRPFNYCIGETVATCGFHRVILCFKGRWWVNHKILLVYCIIFIPKGVGLSDITCWLVYPVGRNSLSRVQNFFSYDCSKRSMIGQCHNGAMGWCTSRSHQASPQLFLGILVFLCFSPILQNAIFFFFGKDCLYKIILIFSEILILIFL